MISVRRGEYVRSSDGGFALGGWNCVSGDHRGFELGVGIHTGRGGLFVWEEIWLAIGDYA